MSIQGRVCRSLEGSDVGALVRRKVVDKLVQTREMLKREQGEIASGAGQSTVVYIDLSSFRPADVDACSAVSSRLGQEVVNNPPVHADTRPAITTAPIQAEAFAPPTYREALRGLAQLSYDHDAIFVPVTS